MNIGVLWSSIAAQEGNSFIIQQMDAQPKIDRRLNLTKSLFFLLDRTSICAIIHEHMNIYSSNDQHVSLSDAKIPLEEPVANHLAELFRSMSDANRLRILSVLLQGEKHVQEISDQVSMSHSAVSHQLRGLRQMQIVRARKQGRLVFYSLEDEHVTQLFQMGLDHVLHSAWSAPGVDE